MTGLVSLLLSVAVAFASPRGEGDAVECLPDNPSFEIGPGLKGNPISGWTVFGNGGLGTGLVSHGTRAAWLYGPFDGTANSSRMRCFAECFGGWSHRLSIDVGHRGDDPLVGSARAFFTVRWRTNTGVVINEQTVQLLNAFAETDVMHTVEADFGPAPGATASMEIEFSFRQTAAQETGRVWLDAFRFDRVNPAVGQWGDFGPVRLDFAGRTWRVKNTFQGPGPNQFSDAPANARVLSDGSLLLAIDQAGGGWRCAEVVVEDVLGYGKYRFTTRGRVDQLDPNIILGLFLWEYVSCYSSAVMWWNPPSEFDIEFSRWGNPAAVPGQFVAQPFDWPGNMSRFDIPDVPEAIRISSEFDWTPNAMICRVWLGDAPEPTPSTLIHQWTYTGPHLPRPGDARIHLNLWLKDGSPPQNFQPASVIIEDFVFTPPGGPDVPCPADLTGDGLVDGGDLGLLLGDWGQGAKSIADLDGNGLVDGGDLGLMLGSWGACSNG
ncbi:MAG: hypothetical protein RLZZ461_277 [Planctomycetota bacterium]